MLNINVKDFNYTDIDTTEIVDYMLLLSKYDDFSDKFKFETINVYLNDKKLVLFKTNFLIQKFNLSRIQKNKISILFFKYTDGEITKKVFINKANDIIKLMYLNKMYDYFNTLIKGEINVSIIKSGILNDVEIQIYGKKYLNNMFIKNSKPSKYVLSKLQINDIIYVMKNNPYCFNLIKDILSESYSIIISEKILNNELKDYYIDAVEEYIKYQKFDLLEEIINKNNTVELREALMHNTYTKYLYFKNI